MIIDKINLVIAFVLFFVGCFGCVISRQHVVKFIISVEIIVLSAMCVFALAAFACRDDSSAIYAILLLPVAAIEVAIYLSVIGRDK